MDYLFEFSEKYLLAREASIKANPEGGLSGLEVEWNLLDSQFHPLLTVGAGPVQQSFVDYLRSEFISPRLREFSQLEVFHWMIEWATQPYYHPRSTIYEARLMEAILINSLFKVGREFDERLFMWHGNLPFLTSVGIDSIPGSWHLAKRRYLERCINLYGDSLATTGTHTNLSLPDELFKWDFIKLPNADRAGGLSPPVHLDEFKSEFYITATRLMRAFACLFIATSASTPFLAGSKNGKPVVYLSKYDSVRNLTFPNPIELDLPDLYQSLESYLNISYDLVRRGIRFGNNNWTPTRARSFAEPVERLIDLTSDQLHELYGRGLFVLGQDQPLEEMVNQIEVQNLLARINLPMARVEIRSDDGGNPLDLEVANITLKHLLLIRIYADREFASSFRYDQEDILRARKNEQVASKFGLRARIENPLDKKPDTIRDFLIWTLAEVAPLAEMLGLSDELIPLQKMATGGPNQAEVLRDQICVQLGSISVDDCAEIPVPLDLLKALAEDREKQVLHDVEIIAETYPSIEGDRRKLGEMLQYCREDVHLDPLLPIRFRPRPEALLEISYPDKTSEILDLAKKLIEIPSVTTGAEERLDEVLRVSTFIYDYLRNHGLDVNYYDQGRYPAILAGFNGQVKAPVMLSGHFDVVAPEPDDSQFSPRQEGDYLWGRGAADMKTVVATNLVWMKDQMHLGEPFPPLNLLLVGNEENGEVEPMGTPHVLELLRGKGYSPALFIAGERTGEKGDELWGEICTENRGVMRFEITARGQKGHSGVASQNKNISALLLKARADIAKLLEEYLTLTGPDNWTSQVSFPFVQIGQPGIYNINPDFGRIGVEIRPIPQDDIDQVYEELGKYCQASELELNVSVKENGIACDPQNPYLIQLIDAVRKTSKTEPRLGKKLPGTSARFAPNGQGIVWGQSGLNPHGRDERHFIPSIMPYYWSLNAFADALRVQ
jgi:acetylornithine deacetylase/succinyl-diaminopimelate desuccinylase-like protein